jgi:hypothetical protein
LLPVPKTSLLLVLLLLFGFTGAFAQGAESRKELTYGVNWNTNGGIVGGISLRSSHTIKERWQQFWGVDIVEVKHPKENRYLGQDGDVFVIGKTNYLFVIRPEFGREYLLFKKAPESGVEVNGVVGIGPSLGLLVPYYINYDYTDYRQAPPGQPIIQDIRTERYDPIVKHIDWETRILGSSGFLTGLNETNVNIGAHLKTAISFEYGRYRENITGVETGFLFEAFPKKLIMLPQAQNYNLFSSVYLTIYYGRRK